MYAWFRNLLTWPLDKFIIDEKSKNEITDKLIASLSEEAAKLPVNENDELAVDWLNGRRTPDANQLLKGAIINLNLATDAPRFFKAIAEATCFGAKAIVERFNEQGIPVKGLIGLGGVANKSPYIMQMMANVINMPIRIHKSEQTCAAGAAMFAATAAGIYNRVEDAMQAMGQGFAVTYYPDETQTAIFSKRYERYQQLGKFIEQQNNQ
jgi:L-ribulokinase